MKKLTLFGLLALTAGAFAETKIATVCMADLVKLHPQHQSHKDQIKLTDSEYKAKIERQQDSLKPIADEGKKIQEDMLNPMLSAAKKAEAQKKLEAVQKRFIMARQDLEQSARRLQEELGELETRLMKLETADIRKKIAEYAEANGFDLIVEEPIVGYARASLDVTDGVLKLMGVDPELRKDLKKNEGK